MADELRSSVAASFSKGSVTESVDYRGITLDVSGTQYLKHNQNIGTSAEAVVFGEVTQAGALIVGRNLDATNFVSFRDQSGGTNFCKVLAGEPFYFRFVGTALFAIADTATVNIEYMVVIA